MTPQTVNAVNLPAPERLEFPGGHPRGAVLRRRRLPTPPITGRLDPSSGTRSATASTTRAALFDARGRLANWWTKEDLAHFTAAGAQLAAQYHAYEPFSGLHVNGRLTLSENIADLAGLSATYDAWKASLGGRPAPRDGEFTGEQQLFLSFAQIWRSKTREAALRQQIVTNGHAPDEYRAATVRNLDEMVLRLRRRPGPAVVRAARRPRPGLVNGARCEIVSAVGRPLSRASAGEVSCPKAPIAANS